MLMTADAHALRRAAFAERLGGAAALIPSGSECVRSRTTHYAFRPASDFFYLTGFREPDAALLLLPEGRSVMFLRRRDALAETWNGRRLGVEAAPEALGVEAAYPIDELPMRLGELLENCQTLCYPLGADATLDAAVLACLTESGERGRGRLVTVTHPRALLHPLRWRKGPEELATMRRAATATAAGFEAAVAAIRPGTPEWAVRAAIEGAFAAAGASAPAYGTIVAGAENATILHYTDCERALEAGSLVLVDAGAEVAGYACDVTRTYPVGGSFSPAQRAVYEWVLAAQAEAIAALVPGAPARRYHEVSDLALTRALIALGVLAGEPEALVASGAHKPYTLHRAGHFLGLDTHDPADWDAQLAPGMVLTVEPGLYFPVGDSRVDPALWGIGVRIEDDVVVTEGEPEVLTAAIPKAVAAVEATLMR